MKRMVMVAVVVAVAALMSAFSAGAALAVSDPALRGTNVGEVLYGTQYPDLIYGFGGADLTYGFAGRDVIYGGHEYGWGDKILGGRSADKLRGQAGDDALYGQRGRDNLNGGPGNDLVVGGHGSDILSGGQGYDEIHAWDGRRDIIIMCGNEYDTVYYDEELDMLRYCLGAINTAADSATDAKNRSNLHAERPPKELFGHSRKVLFEHESDERCVPEKELKAHLKHDDEILNPAGCSSSEKGR